MKKEMNLATTNTVTVLPDARDLAWAANIVKNAPVTSSGARYAAIPMELLHLPSYQREEERRVFQIAANWDEAKCDAILVSYRDGRFYIVDGQHRTAAAKLAGKRDMYSKILVGKTELEEYELFSGQDENVKKVNDYEKIVGGAAIGAEPASGIVNLFSELHVPFAGRGNRDAGILTCMRAVSQLYQRDEGETLRWILETIQALGWAGYAKCYSNSIIMALANFRRVWGSAHGITLAEAREKLILVCQSNYETPERFLSASKVKFPSASGETIALNLLLREIILDS